MRSRGSYTIANAEEGKAAQLDQSYRGCLMALIIFLFLCIILILVCLFAQNSGKSYQSIVAMSQTAVNSPTEKRKPLLIPNADIEPPRGLDDYFDETPESSQFPSDYLSTIETHTTITEQPNVAVTSSTEHNLINDVQSMSSRETNSPGTDNSTASTPRSLDSTTELQNSIVQTTTEKEMIESLHATLADNVTSSESTSIKSQPNSHGSVKSAPKEMASGIFAMFSADDSIEPTQQTFQFTEDLQDSPSVGITEEENRENDFLSLIIDEGISESTSDQSQLRMNKNATSMEEEHTVSSPVKEQTTLIELVIKVFNGEHTSKDNSTFDVVTVRPEQNIPLSVHDDSICTSNACEDKGCKQVASKILSYMDHWGNACVDFYEYACGGFETDYQISKKGLSHRVYEVIKRQAEKTPNYSRSAQFNRYYDSCLNYEVTYNISERIELAKVALEKVGKFYTRTEWENRHDTTDLSELLAKILQNDWPLLFDIVPDIDEANLGIFSLTIGPRPLVFDNKPFQSRHDTGECENGGGTFFKGPIDFDALYGMYDDCKKNSKHLIGSINQTLSAFHIFDSLVDDDDRSQNIQSTIHAIDVDIIEGILKKYSSERKIHEAYSSKNYTVMTLGDLQGNRTSIDWSQLIRSLTKSDLGKDASLYIYNKEEFLEAVNKLEQMWKKRPHVLNNALLGLYSQYLYNTFVTPKSLRDLHNNCLYKAVHSMKDVASALYMQSFTDTEIAHMNIVMKNHFDALKETLRQNIKEIKWATELERLSLLKKLNDIKMVLPERSKEKEANELDIDDNYFENSMKLMKKYRAVMYSMMRKKPSKEIWRFFASPFESTAQTIYALNLIVMPYGAVEVDMKTSIVNYLTLATIGNVIARQIAQNFDMTAMRYWNGFTHNETKDTYENDYIGCHQSLYEDNTVMNWTVSGKSLNVHFKVPTLSLNERLSDIAGLRLARDTLDRLSLNSTRPLPWLDLNVIQLFYLTYVQAHCTKAPLGSLYISLNENPFLPSRIRVYVASNNNGLFDKEWDCPLSTLAPPSECRAFPHLDYDG